MAILARIDHAAAFARYADPALANLGQELGEACERIVASGLGSDAPTAQGRVLHATGGRHERR